MQPVPIIGKGLHASQPHGMHCCQADGVVSGAGNIQRLPSQSSYRVALVVSNRQLYASSPAKKRGGAGSTGIDSGSSRMHQDWHLRIPSKQGVQAWL